MRVLREAADASWRWRDMKARSLCGADQADAAYYELEFGFWADLAGGMSFNDAFAKLDTRWRAHAARNNAAVAAAPRLHLGPSSGHSVIAHRWVSPETAQTRLPWLRSWWTRAETAEGGLFL
jgi:hypothetical protein